MKMNLSQMQVIQYLLNKFETDLYPVFIYKGLLVTANFLPNEFVDLDSDIYKSIYLPSDKLEEKTLTSEYGFFKANGSNKSQSILNLANGHFFDYKLGIDIKDKYQLFALLEAVADNITKGKPIKISFITDVQYLDKSISPKVDFLRLDDKPEFEFISLISKN